jgi:hypothetical protein
VIGKTGSNSILRKVSDNAPKSNQEIQRSQMKFKEKENYLIWVLRKT